MARQQPRLDQNLKAIANAEDAAAAFDEFAERFDQVEQNALPQNLPRGDIVAVAEPAGDGNDLHVVDARWIFCQSIDMH